MSVKDLINAIASGSSIETEQAFNQVMAEKISARLDDMRVDVAQSMFKTESVSHEETEDELNELNASTLTSYVKKAGSSLHKSNTNANKAYNKYDETGDDKHLDKGDKDNHSFNKRLKGITTAASKLNSKAKNGELGEELYLTLEDFSMEEVEAYMQTEAYEQLDELSKTTLVNYVRKATDNAAMHAHDAGSVSQRYAGEPVSKRPDDYDSARKKAVKRIRGVSRAADKLLAK